MPITSTNRPNNRTGRVRPKLNGIDKILEIKYPNTIKDAITEMTIGGTKRRTLGLIELDIFLFFSLLLNLFFDCIFSSVL